jgi:hypothetical protein
MATPAVQPSPDQDNEAQQQATGSSLGPVPNPVETLATGLKTITGGGITKDEPTGTDQMFRTEDGAIKSIQPAAEQSIEQQMQPISEEEFRNRIRSGQIPTVAKIPEGVLQNSLDLLDVESVSAENKARANERLSNAYQLYTMQQDQPSVPVEFGQQTGEGEYVFAPTESAKKNPKELTLQQNIFEGKKAVARVVSGAFGDKLGLNKEDSAIIENIFVRNISTGSFCYNLV